LLGDGGDGQLAAATASGLQRIEHGNGLFSLSLFSLAFHSFSHLLLHSFFSLFFISLLSLFLVAAPVWI
jgi:hypothetical protein